MAPPWRRAALAGVLALATAGVHAGVLDCGFVSYDDGPYVYENPHLREGLSLRSLLWALTAHLTHDASPHLDYWQPVTVLSRLLDVELFGLDPSWRAGRRGDGPTCPWAGSGSWARSCPSSASCERSGRAADRPPNGRAKN